jgi:hypothetical protein
MSYFNRIALRDRGAWDGLKHYFLFDEVSDPADSTKKYTPKFPEVAGIHFGDLNYWLPVASVADVVLPYQADGTDTGTNALIAKLKTAGLMKSEKPVLTVSSLSADLTVDEESVDPEIACAAASDDGRDVAYQWYSNTTDSNEGGSAIEGADEATYVLPTYETNGAYYYYCVATLEGETVTSEVVVVTVYCEVPVLTVASVSADQAILVNVAPAAVTCSITSSDERPVSYQWYSNTSDANTGGTLIEGATENEYEPQSVAEAGTLYFYCEGSLAGVTQATDPIAIVVSAA